MKKARITICDLAFVGSQSLWPLTRAHQFDPVAGFGKVRGKQFDADAGSLKFISAHLDGRTGNEAGNSLADQNALPKLFGELFDPGGFVCRLTNHSKIDTFRNTNIAVNHITNMHAQPIIKWRLTQFFTFGI